MSRMPWRLVRRVSNVVLIVVEVPIIDPFQEKPKSPRLIVIFCVLFCFVFVYFLNFCISWLVFGCFIVISIVRDWNDVGRKQLIYKQCNVVSSSQTAHSKKNEQNFHTHLLWIWSSVTSLWGKIRFGSSWVGVLVAGICFTMGNCHPPRRDPRYSYRTSGIVKLRMVNWDNPGWFWLFCEWKSLVRDGSFVSWPCPVEAETV